jgi:transcriptional regulator with PAS, ATPase and Fis domain
MHELLEEGFVKESISLNTIKSGQPETMIQELGDGNQVLVSSQPVFEDGKIAYVITTEKDITEIQILKDLLCEKDMDSEKRADEIEYLKMANMRIYGEIIAVDPVSKLVIDNVRRVAGLDTSVLLTGEPGTGKETYTNLIYRSSKRRGKPFIKVNISSLPEDRIEAVLFGYERGAFAEDAHNEKRSCFELANGGTLFLDEVCDIPIRLQAMLLSTIHDQAVTRIGGSESIPIDVRLVCTSHADIKKSIADGTFREDLYYTLAVMPIVVPPLRQRRSDIAPLASEFTRLFNKEYRLKKYLTSSAIIALEQYDWPGNIRELRNIMERVTIMYDGNEINRFQIEQLLYPRDDFAFSLESDDGTGNWSYLYDQLEEFEKRLIDVALARRRNASEASKRLGIDKSTISRRMKKYGIKKSQ